eukprot:TRINITY_DN4755_c0_g1_i4.p1 TRINITY_DN4755_c0_g1~~TRINITY_DN4755_c0_g1_i4.p1  ORF type:complete len:276 (-),score=65.59 TRINITY_DN4755_c0_g1_i4:31-810(-)
MKATAGVEASGGGGGSKHVVKAVLISSTPRDALVVLSQLDPHSAAAAGPSAQLVAKSPHMGVDFTFVTVQMDDGSSVVLQLWLLWGMDQFPSVVRSVFRGTKLVLLAYDAHKFDSFMSIKVLSKFVDDNSPSPRPDKMLVAVVSDPAADPAAGTAVSSATAEQWAKSVNMAFAPDCTPAAMVPVLLTLLNTVLTAMGAFVPHKFQSSTFNKPTYCDHCGGFIWGLHHQGKMCKGCKSTVHHRCAELCGGEACKGKCKNK